MKLMKIPGRRKPIRVAEWKDMKEIVERLLKEERPFLSRMANQ